MKEIRTAMGYVETVGLAAAIAAADAALKAANVRLIGREISKGGGMVTVKLSGNVGAVRAAVAAARAEGARVSEIVSARVIARPALTHGPVMGYNADTMGVEEWLRDMGVQDAPLAVHRPEGRRGGAAIRRKAKSVTVEEAVQEPSETAGLAEARQAAVRPSEAVPVEPEVSAAEPVREEKAIPEVADEKPEAENTRRENRDETANAEALRGEEAEPAGETVKTETPKRRRRTSRKKASPVEKAEGEASDRTPKRRTRRKKASDSENNETSGRS